MNPYLTFFHNSLHHWKTKPSLFKPMLRGENLIKPSRPAFYWFNDKFHSNFSSVEHYFYLFVKNPKKDKIAFRPRHVGLDFNGLCVNQYDQYQEERKAKDISKYFLNHDYKNYSEPSIIMSFDEIEPDIVIEFADKPIKDEKYGTIIFPDSHKGLKISLFDQNCYPIKFTNIPEIVDIVPKINFSYPFLIPDKVDGKYVYDDWLPMITERMGSWL